MIRTAGNFICFMMSSGQRRRQENCNFIFVFNLYTFLDLKIDFVCSLQLFFLSRGGPGQGPPLTTPLCQAKN